MTQRSILSFVKSKSAVAIPSNQSNETLSQAETLNSEDQWRATDSSGLLYVRETSGANLEFSEQDLDLTTTANQRSSVELEVVESANEQDIDLTGKENSDVSSKDGMLHLQLIQHNEVQWKPVVPVLRSQNRVRIHYFQRNFIH